MAVNARVPGWRSKSPGGVAACGAKSFLDEAEIDVGADFEEEILSFLERADELLVLLAPWALDRLYIWAEIQAAWGRRVPIAGLLHGITAAELQSKAGIPVLLNPKTAVRAALTSLEC